MGLRRSGWPGRLLQTVYRIRQVSLNAGELSRARHLMPSSPKPRAPMEWTPPDAAGNELAGRSCLPNTVAPGGLTTGWALGGVVARRCSGQGGLTGVERVHTVCTRSGHDARR
jgi:hypothetical protein